mmetsp:Transcript_10481/g.22769  ORF Transcript_10481/g.22769 Transcript_10481/m.22769 type:complete len:257 (+) Transcript_10481:1465-2235(+)
MLSGLKSPGSSSARSALPRCVARIASTPSTINPHDLTLAIHIHKSRSHHRLQRLVTHLWNRSHLLPLSNSIPSYNLEYPAPSEYLAVKGRRIPCAVGLRLPFLNRRCFFNRSLNCAYSSETLDSPSNAYPSFNLAEDELEPSFTSESNASPTDWSANPSPCEPILTHSNQPRNGLSPIPRDRQSTAGGRMRSKIAKKKFCPNSSKKTRRVHKSFTKHQRPHNQHLERSQTSIPNQIFQLGFKLGFYLGQLGFKLGF